MSSVDLYAIRCAATGQIKIGRSSNVKRRLADIGSYLRCGFDVIGVAKNCGRFEPAIHALLRGRRIDREWFRLDVHECVSLFEALHCPRVIDFLGRMSAMTPSEASHFAATLPSEFVAMALSGRLAKIERRRSPTQTTERDEQDARIDRDMRRSRRFDGRALARLRWAGTSQAERTAIASSLGRARARKLTAARRREIARAAGLASARKRIAGVNPESP